MSNPTHAALGYKVINYALSAFAWGVSLAVAWSCSTVLMGIIMFIVMALLMALLTYALNIYLVLKLDTDTVEGLGRNVGDAIARVTSLFTRKVAA